MLQDIKETLDKGKSELASESEKNEALALFHRAEHEYELKGILLNELENTEVVETSSPFFKKLFTKLWTRIEKRKNEPRSKVRYIKTLGRIAAAVLIGLIIGIYSTSIKTFHKAVYYEAHSPKGSIFKMIFPDSSIIVLNAGSKIKYSYDGDKGIREIFLNGEAWFDVHKNKKKPFVVHTACYDVNVTGTQFNIKSYESDSSISTTLEKGEVIITGTEKFKLAENITLVPGEQVVLDRRTKQITIKEVNTKWFSSWKDNKLIFVNMNIKDLVLLLERKYGVDIEMNCEDITGLHFDGTIKNETIIEILDIIKETLPIDYKIIDHKIIITTIN